MIQMRSGLTPAANIDAAVKLIGEAKAAGADYVQTPEMTNILAAKPRAAVRHHRAEEKRCDPRRLPRARAQARDLSPCRLAGHQALPDKAANRGFLIDPQGEIVARYDKIHMFDVDLAGGESYRESSSYRPGELAVLPICRGAGSA